MPVDGCDVLQICDLHKGLMKVVKLQNTGQQEEAWDHNTGEELRQFKRLQSHVSQPKDGEPHAIITSNVPKNENSNITYLPI